MPHDLVIVESPGKVRKISEYLGAGFHVVPTFGHFRDLPDGPGIEVAFDGDQVRPNYEVTERGRKAVAELKRHAKDAKTIYLATDSDREGEAIAWHITQVLGERRSYRRAVFTEITATAIRAAIAQARDLNHHLVDAQQARRVLDRVVGWVVSPTVRGGTGNDKARSAGRVQSVAVRLVVDRERAITSFKPVSYFVIDAGLTAATPPPFRARLMTWEGAEVGHRIATTTAADAIVAFCKQHPWWVLSTEAKPVDKRPPAPFDTSTLQQAASVELKSKPKDTMAAAQRLYEAGLITYMRTDSTSLAAEAVAEIRAFIGQHFPAEYLPAAAVVHATTQKGAQEAHEAIRPTHITTQPQDVPGDDGKLYHLIWTRTLACQMATARDQVTTIHIGVGPDPAAKPPGVFLARGTVTQFEGWRKAVRLVAEDRVEEDPDLGDPTESLAELPRVQPGQPLKLGLIQPASRTTKAPARFTQASLIKALKHYGVGRPSTYAPILDTIIGNGYVTDTKGRLGAADIGCTVVDFLISHYAGHMIELDFTARVEADLDRIAAGTLPWQPTVARFAYEVLAKSQAAGLNRNPLVDVPRAPATKKAKAAAEPGVTCPTCKGPMTRRPGKFGDFLSCQKYPTCTGTRNLGGATPPPKPPTPSTGAKAGSKPAGDGHACPLCQAPMIERKGPLVAGKPKFHFLGCSTFPHCRGMRNPDGSPTTPTGKPTR